MAERRNPDSKTKEVFELLDLTDPDKREEFLRMSVTPTVIRSEVQAHFRLDSLTSGTEDDSDAELA